MTAVLLTTRLKVADPTALTALATLRDRLGFPAIGVLSREEVFLFVVQASADESVKIVDDLARRTNLFMNPNKHVHRIATRETVHEAKGQESWALVWTPGDGDDLKETLWRHIGATKVSSVRRGWAWRFLPSAGAPLEEFRRQVRDSLVLSSRTQGFLVNPAYQESRLYERRPTVYDTEEALLAGGSVAAESSSLSHRKDF